MTKKRKAKSSENDTGENDDDINDCATPDERSKYQQVFLKCIEPSKTFDSFKNEDIIPPPQNSNSNGNDNDCSDSQDDDIDVSDLVPTVGNQNVSNNDETTNTNSSQNNNINNIVPLPNIEFKIDSLINHDLSKNKNCKQDFKKFLLYPAVLIDYVKKNNIKKKTYFDTISFMKTRLNHCAMISFNCSIRYGLMGLNTFCQSNFSRFSAIATKICKTLTSIKVLRLCLIQKIDSIDKEIFKQAIELHLKSKDWCKWSNRKTCMITVQSGSRSIGACGNKI